MYYNTLKEAMVSLDNKEMVNTKTSQVYKFFYEFIQENAPAIYRIIYSSANETKTLELRIAKNIYLRIGKTINAPQANMGEEEIFRKLYTSKSGQPTLLLTLFANKTDGHIIYDYEGDIQRFFDNSEQLLADFAERNR